MPNAKKIAREQQVSLRDVAEFAGKSILKRQDVQAYLDQEGKDAAEAKEAEDTRIPLTTMRKVIARRMLESSANIPSFQATVEVDMTNCIALRGQ